MNNISNKIKYFCLPSFERAEDNFEFEKAYKETMKNLVEKIAMNIKNSNNDLIDFFKDCFCKIKISNQLNNLGEALEILFEEKVRKYLGEIENKANESINNMDSQIILLNGSFENTYNYINNLIYQYKRLEFEMLMKAIPQKTEIFKQELAYKINTNIHYKLQNYIKNQKEEIINSIKHKKINNLINFIENCYYQEQISESIINDFYEDFKSEIRKKYDKFVNFYKDINSFYLNLKESFIYNAIKLRSNKPEWKNKLDNHFALPEIKQMINNISSFDIVQLKQFKMNNYLDYYNELYNLRNKYGLIILNENDYIKKIEKTIKEIKSEIDNKINMINNKDYQKIINELTEKLNSQERIFDKKLDRKSVV